MVLQIRVILPSLSEKHNVHSGHKLEVEKCIWDCQNGPQWKGKETINGT